ncbi:TauD/TfdA family dioxygenase [Amycolatopsis saalfeldensis]|uniref:Taurine catabolism dioxygenase TauD, TfdA family n=1 Tax=Amycolatopsis saalfeldensis TaxID=394193 RepID=A0A1H8Y3H3_9PSEU|nr:TauD/TfdA family dioxygenase [Amycolatopsis saalfeldensis]SEP46543.1 Taurine catabolism dioxygenase TauD, TfdA family [Amycolatopsis saalfeldensis]
MTHPRHRVPVAPSLATALAENDLSMDGHAWAAPRVEAARAILRAAGAALVHSLADRLTLHGWAIAAFPEELSDELLRRAAAGALAGVGVPFFSIDGGRGLWLDGLSGPERDPSSFGGVAAQALHIDAPNVTAPPDYTSLLMLRPDPAGGGHSILADLRAAAVLLADDNRDVLRRPVFFEGRAEQLHGVGEPLLPFPILEDGRPGDTWIRWAGKLLTDQRNTGHRPVLERFASLLHLTTQRVLLRRGELLIADQRRVAHGRTALGRQDNLAPSARRLLCQAKARLDAAAPVHQVPGLRSAA